jgi:hypothetical protein
MILRYAALVLLIASGATAILAGAAGLTESAVRGTILGAGLAAAGAIGGMAIVAWSFDRRPQAFMAALVGGILGRLLLFGAALVFVELRATTYDLGAVVASLLGFYVAFQVIEVRFVLKGIKEQRS